MSGETDSRPEEHKQMSAVLNKFGLYQRRLLLLIIIPLIGEGYRIMSTVIIFATPDFRCRVPGLANDTYSIQNDAHRMLVNLSIPMTSSNGDVSYSKCDVYKDREVQHANRTLYDDTETCDSWVYDDTDFEETILTEFDLVCDKKGFRANFNMVYLLGMLVGSCLSGYICDRFGRKKMFMLGNTLGIVVIFLSAFPVLTPLLLLYRFLSAAFGIAAFIALYVLCIEFMGPKRRTLAGSLVMVLFVMGVLTLGVLSFAVRDWRWLQILNGVPFIICLSYWWLLDESPRWLLAKGHTQEAQRVILKVMKVNKILVSSSTSLSGEAFRMDDTHPHNTPDAKNIDCWDTQTEDTDLMADTDNENDYAVNKEGKVWTNKQDTDKGCIEINVETENERQTPRESFLKLFKFPNLIARTGIIFFNWSAASTTYFGLSLNVGNLTGSIRLNFLLSASVELVGYSMAWVLLDRLGRKRTHCAAMLLSGTSCLAAIFSVMYGGPELQWVTILLVMLGKLGISAAFNSVYLLSGELFPTVIRNQGMGCSSTVSRIAAALSPYIADLSLHIEGSVGRAVPLVIFGSLALAAGLLALCLPETLHRTLPDTILQAASFTRQQRNNHLHVPEVNQGTKEKSKGKMI